MDFYTPVASNLHIFFEMYNTRLLRLYGVSGKDSFNLWYHANKKITHMEMKGTNT